MAVVAAAASPTVAPAGSLLALEGLAKTYPNGTTAVRGVTMAVGPGSVHGLVGANGAGKSTLIKMICGAVEPSGGSMNWKGDAAHFSGPKGARRAGIAVVHQHTPLVGTLSVAENVLMADEDSWRHRRAAVEERTEEIAGQIGYVLDPTRLVSELSVGERQMVALLQALAGRPELLVLDEPTASLSHGERSVVFQAVRKFVEDGRRSVLFVSHLLDEVMALTDHLTVLRDGVIALSRPTSSVTPTQLVQAIVGRAAPEGPVERSQAVRADGPAGVGLEVSHLSSPGKIHDVSFRLAPGEIVGLAGLLGSGRSEILHAVFGADPHSRGEVRLDGRVLRRSPVAAVKAGLALVPEDRGSQGYVPGWEIWRNMSLPSLGAVSWRRFLVRPAAERERSRALMETLSVRAQDEEALVDELSGGNAQKVVLAKWLHEGVRVLMLDEPTAGIDIGAKRDVQALIRRLAADGRSVLLVESEISELLAVCDRVLVVNRGSIVAEVPAAETHEEELVALASGLPGGDPGSSQTGGQP